MGYLLKHARLTMDPYARGHTSHALMALGYPMTRGLMFPFTGGGVVMLRRRLYPVTGAWSYCGFARPAETTITNMPGFDHGANTAWQYTAARILGNGFISLLAEPVRVDFDGGGARITPALPTFPLHIVAKAIAGGKFRIIWEYDPFGQGAYPKDFQVFSGTETVMNFASPVPLEGGGDSVAYAGGQRRFEAITQNGPTDGTKVRFGVRARNSGGVEEQNTRTTLVYVARALGPADATTTALVMRSR